MNQKYQILNRPDPVPLYHSIQLCAIAKNVVCLIVAKFGRTCYTVPFGSSPSRRTHKSGDVRSPISNTSALSFCSATCHRKERTKVGTSDCPFRAHSLHCSVRQLTIAKNAREWQLPIIHNKHKCCIVPFGNIPSERIHESGYVRSSLSGTLTTLFRSAAHHRKERTRVATSDRPFRTQVRHSVRQPAIVKNAQEQLHLIVYFGRNRPKRTDRSKFPFEMWGCVKAARASCMRTSSQSLSNCYR